MEEQESSEDSEGENRSDSDEVGRVVELVRAAGPDQTWDPELTVHLKARRGSQKTQITWLADSGVNRILILETSWEKLRQENPHAVEKEYSHFQTLLYKIQTAHFGESKGENGESEREEGEDHCVCGGREE